MELLIYFLYVLFAWSLIRAIQMARWIDTVGRRLPPGPIPFPVIGNLLQLGNKPHKSLAALANVYGPIMTLQLGQITTVVISNATFAKEILQKHDLSFSSHRAVPDAVRAHDHDRVSMVWLPVAARWRNLRKISNSYIFSSHRLDENRHLRQQKVEELIASVADCCQTGAAVDIGSLAFRTSLNLLSNTIFSIDLVDPKTGAANELKELVWGIMEEVGKPNLVDYFPILTKFDPQRIRQRLAIHFEKMFQIFDSMIHERLELRKRQNSADSWTKNDVLDILLNISEDNETDEIIDRNDFKDLFLDLFAAGTDTTSNTVEWAMTELLCNPETLSKAKVELDRIIGKGNRMEEADIARLPYLEAILKETFRLHPPAPLLLPRKVEKKVDFFGFLVPKGTQVLLNAWAIGRDPGIWENPESFLPERFLGLDLDVKGQNFELIPFGGGRRICPGLSLATRIVPLMVASLIHGFQWSLEDGVLPETIDMEDKFGITLQKAQPLRAIPFQG